MPVRYRGHIIDLRFAIQTALSLFLGDDLK